MNKKIIFVNATSATVGGSLTILNQFIENVINLEDINKFYYIFVPEECKLESNEYLKIVPIKAKKYLDRIKWDISGIRKWAKKMFIYPNIIISLQNTGVRFNKVRQIIYLHQPLPYAKESSWSLLKKDERKMWFYKYLYKIWIDRSIKKDHYIVVQTEWMKNALIEDGYNKKNILVSKPNINKIDIDKIKLIERENDKFYCFYPAADYKYKNHKILLESLKILKNNNPNLLDKIKIIFTLSKKSNLYNEAVKNNLDNNVKFLGNLRYEEILKYYKTCDLVLFPSYIETFGLPLVEASSFGKKILVSDCSYSREVLKGYKLCEFIDFDDSQKWAKAIENSMKFYKECPMNKANLDSWNIVFNLINKI